MQRYWECIDFGLGLVATLSGNPWLVGATFAIGVSGDLALEGIGQTAGNAGREGVALGVETYVERAAKFYGISESGIIGLTQGSVASLLLIYSGYGCDPAPVSRTGCFLTIMPHPRRL
jgi:hypothetical protein